MTGKQRLKVLANYLVSGAVDDKKFDMHSWHHCAIGEGTRLPSLAKDGLRLEGSSSEELEPEYDGDTGIWACSEFFRIPYSIADKFFYPYKAEKAAIVGQKLLNYLRKR